MGQVVNTLSDFQPEIPVIIVLLVVAWPRYRNVTAQWRHLMTVDC